MARIENKYDLADSKRRVGFVQRFLWLLLLAGVPYGLVDFAFRFRRDGLTSWAIWALSAVSFAVISAVAVHLIASATRSGK